jgi:glyoxylase-like metal-dependent hydrolase (beta-lactamase superfamily II)
MNPSERELDYVFLDRLPEPGTSLPVAPGISWVRMPLPFALDHINLWLVEDLVDGDDRWTLIDCGIGDAVTRGHWEAVFDHSLGGVPVHRVLCTHSHPDHFGLANWLCEGGDTHRWQARLWMTLGEYATGRLLATAGVSAGTGGATAAEHMKRHGFADEVALEQIAHKAAYYPTLVPAVPGCFRRLRGGDVIDMAKTRWRVIAGYGHSPEHAALYSEALNVLIAGDMVLPRISTNVSVFDLEPEGDPLGAFLESLDAYNDLPADTLVLPSHGKPFRGLHIRLRQLREHHTARLAEVEAACREAPLSAADIVPIMFRRKLDTHQMTFALGEALAHLHYLLYRGVLTRIEDAEGVYRFQRQA